MKRRWKGEEKGEEKGEGKRLGSCSHPFVYVREGATWRLLSDEGPWGVQSWGLVHVRP